MLGLPSKQKTENREQENMTPAKRKTEIKNMLGLPSQLT